MLLAAASPPAGGAPIDQVAIATGFATMTTAVLLYLLQGHRSGRSSILGRIAALLGARQPHPELGRAAVGGRHRLAAASRSSA